MSGIRRAVVLSLTVFSSLALACGGLVSESGGGGGGSSGGGGGGGAGGTSGEAGGPGPGSNEDGGPGVGPTFDGESPVPSGAKRLATGDELVLWGVTTDDYVIYSAGGDVTTPLYAVSLAGGPPTEIDTLSFRGQDASSAFVIGPLVFVFTSGPVTTGPAVATLKAWSAGGGLHTLSKNAYANADTNTVAVSSDSRLVAYLDNDPSSGDVEAYVANADGTGATLLQSGVRLTRFSPIGALCNPRLEFAGSTAVLGTCGDSTGNGAKIYSYAPPTFSRTIVATGVAVPRPVLDMAGGNVLYSTSAGLFVAPISGGTPTSIDPSGRSGLFTSDGSSVVYVAQGGSMRRSPVASPSPMVLVGSGTEGIDALAPDDSTVLAFESENGNLLSDLYTASAVSPGSLTTLNTETTTALAGYDRGLTATLVYGSSFTRDGSHVLYYTAVKGIPALGTLEVSAIGSSPPVTLAEKSHTAYASGPTKVVFEANFDEVAPAPLATIDIEAFDTSSGGDPVVVVHQATATGHGMSTFTPGFYLSTDGSEIVYAQSGEPGTSGVFVVPVP